MSKYELRMIEPRSVAFSKHNPRGENRQQISDDPSFEQLKDSVAQHGVLVPLVVHRRAAGDKRYVLVDGERRLRAALATGIRKVPAHIASSESPVDEHIQAFHIHMLRKQWKPVATARALKRIRADMRKLNSPRTEQELLEELRVATGCTLGQLQNLQRGSRYPAAVLDDVDTGLLKWSHLVQFEASFVEQLRDQYPALLQELGVRKIREVLVSKARAGILTNTRVFINYVTPVMMRARTADERRASTVLFRRFIVEESMTAEEIKRRFDREFPPSRDTIARAEEVVEIGEDLLAGLEQMDVGQLLSFPAQSRKVETLLARLLSAVRKSIRQLKHQQGL